LVNRPSYEGHGDIYLPILCQINPLIFCYK
jgi:hypothetical protein